MGNCTYPFLSEELQAFRRASFKENDVLYGASNEVDFRFGIESGRGHCPNSIRKIYFFWPFSAALRSWNENGMVAVMYSLQHCETSKHSNLLADTVSPLA